MKGGRTLPVLPLLLLSLRVIHVTLCFNLLPSCPELDHFDFIIVGGGTTGGVIANRLSENPNFRVLVLEAGVEPDATVDKPDGFQFLFSPSTAKFYKTVPQENMKGIFKTLGMFLPQGNTLGGTSSINYMIYSRGDRRDFDVWESLGNRGWSWKDVEPYFLKMEDYRVPYAEQDAKYHSKGGPVTVTWPYVKTPVADAILEAGNELGYSLVDLDGEYQKGFSYVASFIRNQTRWETFRAYIDPARRRPNLSILIQSYVTRIIIEDNQAKGVEYLRNEKTCTVLAKKEVIISAGALKSPQILMLSGIGPQEILEKFKIPIIKELPVGLNLVDHVVYFMGFMDIKAGALNCNEKSGLLPIIKPGPLGTSVKTIATLNSSFIKDGDPPDLEIFSMYQGLVLETLSAIFSTKDILTLKDGTNMMQMVIVLTRPKSTGLLTLASADPKADPLIDPNYLSHPDDFHILKEGVEYFFKIANSEAMKPYLDTVYEKGLIPGCQQFVLYTDEFWDCIIRSFSLSSFHFAGTCKMGNATDTTAVVDSQLRVHGISGLRVADASIMPTLPNGHTAAQCMMIGEKASDLIKQTWDENFK